MDQCAACICDCSLLNGAAVGVMVGSIEMNSMIRLADSIRFIFVLSVGRLSGGASI